jgi:hypothetical protein
MAEAAAGESCRKPEEAKFLWQDRRFGLSSRCADCRKILISLIDQFRTAPPSSMSENAGFFN